MNTPKIISDIHSLISAVVAANKLFSSQVWWRGQENSDWELIPSVFREKQGAAYEQNIIHRFRQKAQVRHPNLPSTDDYYGWLFLMQHYRLPTRLLDWTESPLNACFFALGGENNKKNDGCLYALNPFALNQSEINLKGIIVPNNKGGFHFIEKAFNPDAIDINKVLAIDAFEVDIRMMIQLSNFTVHGSGKSISECVGYENFLLKFLIPSSSKKQIREELKYLGIRESNLFPDLEHLAQEIKSTTFKTDLSIENNSQSANSDKNQDSTFSEVSVSPST